MTANQFAVLLALYRGLRVAVDAEAWRSNFCADLKALEDLGLVYRGSSAPAPIVLVYHTTLRGEEVVKSALLLAQ